MKALLEKRERTGNYRRLSIGENLIDFASNDYLGLARHQGFIRAIKEEWKGCVGSTGSRLMTGDSHYAEELEASLAQFHGFESALLCGCGYMANIGLLSALGNVGGVFFYDIQVHASLHDGLRLGRACAVPFRHNDLNHLEQRLQAHRGTDRRWIIVESIYSTDGSQAHLEDLCALAGKYQARLIVDEAHAVGVRGEGRGLVAEKNLVPKVFALVVTFGKALGSYGAAVLGSTTLKDYLINFARPFIYSTALPYPVLASIKCAYQFLPTLQAERTALQRLNADTHIQSIPVKGNSEAHQLSQFLQREGFDVRPLLSPTVPAGQERLRLSLHAFNTNEELTRLSTLCINFGIPLPK